MLPAAFPAALQGSVFPKEMQAPARASLKKWAFSAAVQSQGQGAVRTWRPVALASTGGVTLDGAVLHTHAKQSKMLRAQASVETPKWVLMMHGNGSFFELQLAFAAKVAKHANASVLVFNFRGATYRCRFCLHICELAAYVPLFVTILAGLTNLSLGPSRLFWLQLSLFPPVGVGLSTGLATSDLDLLDDATAALHHILSTGAAPRDILIYGHSLGGGLGAQLRARYPEGPIISDRSFSTLPCVPSSWIQQLLPSSPPPPSSVAAKEAARGKDGKDKQKPSRVRMLLLKTKALLLAGLRRAMQALQWEMDAQACWQGIQGHKFVIFHPADEIINLTHASLAQALLHR